MASIVMMFIAITLQGCSTGRPSLGAISVAVSGGTGQVNSVSVGNSVNVTVSVSGDTAGLGVDWNLLCGGSAVTFSNPNPCGTITPVHVGSNINMTYLAPPYIPAGSTVTLTASSTSDPSQSASVTLTITPQPVVIQFTPSPQTQLAAGGTTQITATISNDLSYSGVSWTVSCNSKSCGSFSQMQTGGGAGQYTTYTAPSTIPTGGTVTVTASSVSSPQSSISATIQIMPISVSTPQIQPNPVPFSASATLTASAEWDAQGQGISWSTPTCNAADCGTVTVAQPCAQNQPASTNTTVCTATYVAPASSSVPVGTTLQVSVTATSVADSTKSATLSFTVEPPPPISVSLTANPSGVQTGTPPGTTTLTAVAANDFSGAGIAWQCTPACNPATSTNPASISGNSATYTTAYIPSVTATPGPVTVMATSLGSSTTAPATTTITIYPQIQLEIIQQPQSVTPGQAASFTATVTNDIAPGGVDWTASGCPSATNCGTFSSPGSPGVSNNHSASGTPISYTPPTGIQWPLTNPSVTITATASATEPASGNIPPVQSQTISVPVAPVPFVRFVPFAPSTLPAGSPSPATLISLVAAVVNDSTKEGADWTVSCPDASVAACGQFLETPMQAAKVVGGVTAPAVPAVFWPYGQKAHAASGQAVVYEPPTQMPSGGQVTLMATSTGNPSASASQVVTITSNLSGPTLSGKVQAGNLPVSRATVQLFVAASTGYASATSPITLSGGGNSVTSANDGSFTIPAGYVCPGLNSLVYLVALGGKPGGPSDPTNPQLGFISALGPCSNLSSSVPLVVNEVTTVASVFALSPFIGTDYNAIGASSSNYNNGPYPANNSNYSNGLANAFATVNNLVDITTGQALPVTPAGNGTVPQAEINTLADAIDTCSVTGGGQAGDGSACDALFEASNVNPPGGAEPTTSNAPKTILQAIIEVAHVPSTSLSEGISSSPSGDPLYTLVANQSNPPFQPTLTAAPYDWSMSIGYSGGGLDGKRLARPGSKALAVDASGNLWIANSNISSVTELTNTGAPLSPFATGTAAGDGGGFTGAGLSSPSQIAIDPYGEAWVLNNNSTVSALGVGGTALSPSSGFSGGGSYTGEGLAIDVNGNVWVAEQGSTVGDVAEYAGYNGGTTSQVGVGAPLSPQGIGFAPGSSTDQLYSCAHLAQENPPVPCTPIFNHTLFNPNGAIAVDGLGNIWIFDQGNYAAVELSGAVSSAGNYLDADQGDTIDQNSGQPNNPPQYTLGSSLGSSDFPVSMVIDHAGDIFAPDASVNATTGTIYELFAGAASSNYGGTGQTESAHFLEAGATTPPIEFSSSFAIDGAGSLWAVASPAPSGLPPLPQALGEWSSSGKALNLNYLAQGFVASSLPNNAIPSTVAVDASGNVWVLSGNSSGTNLAEFVGVAAPVVTPFSVAANKNKLGSKP